MMNNSATIDLNKLSNITITPQQDFKFDWDSAKYTYDKETFTKYKEETNKIVNNIKCLAPRYTPFPSHEYL